MIDVLAPKQRTPCNVRTTARIEPSWSSWVRPAWERRFRRAAVDETPTSKTSPDESPPLLRRLQRRTKSPRPGTAGWRRFSRTTDRPSTQAGESIPPSVQGTCSTIPFIGTWSRRPDPLPPILPNTLLDVEHRLIEVVSGHWEKAHEAGCQMARKLFTCFADVAVDAVITAPVVTLTIAISSSPSEHSSMCKTSFVREPRFSGSPPPRRIMPGVLDWAEIEDDDALGMLSEGDTTWRATTPSCSDNCSAEPTSLCTANFPPQPGLANSESADRRHRPRPQLAHRRRDAGLQVRRCAARQRHSCSVAIRIVVSSCAWSGSE